MIDFRAIGHRYGIPIIDGGHHHCAAGWLQTHCPFCSPGSGFHLGFSLERGNFHCWRCGGHRVMEVLAKLCGGEASAKEAVSKYREGSRQILPTIPVRLRTAWIPRGIRPLRPAHLHYLKGRKFNPDLLVKEWGLLGTDGLSELGWRWRVIFPIQNREGNTIAYGGRAIGKGVKPKYRFPTNRQFTQDPRGVLYGIDRVEGDAVVICEGPTDVWRLGPGAVALMGVDWKTEQADALKGFRRRYIMLDPDPAGKRKAEDLAHWLAMYSGETEIIEDLPCDPGDLPQREADQIMKELIYGQ